MPALNFQAQFAADVESGRKPTSIRGYRKDGRNPKVGDTLHLFTGMRTKKCRKLGVGIVESVTPVEIFPGGSNYDPAFYLVGPRGGRHRQSLAPLTKIARADGFDSHRDFIAFFEKTHGLPFKGLLIRWRLQ